MRTIPFRFRQYRFFFVFVTVFFSFPENLGNRFFSVSEPFDIAVFFPFPIAVFYRFQPPGWPLAQDHRFFPFSIRFQYVSGHVWRPCRFFPVSACRFFSVSVCRGRRFHCRFFSVSGAVFFPFSFAVFFSFSCLRGLKLETKWKRCERFQGPLRPCLRPPRSRGSSPA